MEVKKFLTGAGALCLAVLLFLPAHRVGAAEPPSGGTTNLTTTVPDAHTVRLDIGTHGSVIINGKVYTSKNKETEIARLEKQTYIIQADKGWQADKVSYGQKGEEKAVKLADNTFSAPAIHSDDNQLTVTFKKASAGSNGGKPSTSDTSKNGKVKTGDTANILLYGVILLFSVCFLIVTIRGLQSRNKNL